MRKGRIATLLPLAAALLAACGGSGGDRAAAADTPAVHKVWTPEQARALRQARDSAYNAPPQAAVPVPGPAEGEDSVQWLAAEKAKYDERVRSMEPFAECMAQARDVRAEIRPTLEAACRRLPSAPKP
jgi:outer membrane biogenesis lipoprotein LolB